MVSPSNVRTEKDVLQKLEECEQNMYDRVQAAIRLAQTVCRFNLRLRAKAQMAQKEMTEIGSDAAIEDDADLSKKAEEASHELAVFPNLLNDLSEDADLAVENEFANSRRALAAAIVLENAIAKRTATHEVPVHPKIHEYVQEHRRLRNELKKIRDSSRQQDKDPDERVAS